MNPHGEDDPWPDEPDEFDPDSLGPGPPTVDPPEVRAPGSDDVPPELLQVFWRTVVLCNVALFGLSLAVLLAVFRGDLLLAGGSLLVGSVAGLFAARYYLGVTRGNMAGSGDTRGGS